MQRVNHFPNMKQLCAPFDLRTSSAAPTTLTGSCSCSCSLGQLTTHYASTPAMRDCPPTMQPPDPILTLIHAEPRVPHTPSSAHSSLSLSLSLSSHNFFPYLFSSDFSRTAWHGIWRRYSRRWGLVRRSSRRGRGAFPKRRRRWMHIWPRSASSPGPMSTSSSPSTDCRYNDFDIILTIFRALSTSTLPHTRRVRCPAWCPCIPGADRGLRFDVVTDLGLCRATASG